MHQAMETVLQREIAEFGDHALKAQIIDSIVKWEDTGDQYVWRVFEISRGELEKRVGRKVVSLHFGD